MAKSEKLQVGIPPDYKSPLSIEKAVGEIIEIQGPYPEDTSRSLYGSPDDLIYIHQEKLPGGSSILALKVRRTTLDKKLLKEIIENNLPTFEFDIKENLDEEGSWAIVSSPLPIEEVTNAALGLAGIGNRIAEM